MKSGTVSNSASAPLLSDFGGNCTDVESNASEKLSIDDMLSKHVGDFGRAQLVHFVIVSLAWSLEGLHTFVTIFADREPEWQCRSSVNLRSLSNSTLTASPGPITMECSPSSSICSMDPSLWEWVGGKGVSIVSEWGLFCGDEYKVGLAQSAFFVGAFVGAGIFGHFSDSFAGRKGTLFLACICTGLSGLATASVHSYWVYVGIRLLTGATCSGIGLSSFVLATEPIGPSKRGQVGMSAFYFFSLGIMTLPVFAYFSTSWRHLYFVTSIPSLLYCTLVVPTIWESPRWFLVQGRIKDAMHVLGAFAKRNGRNPIPEGVVLEIENEEASKSKAAETDDVSEEFYPKASGTLLMVIRNPATRSRILIMAVIWFLTAVVYYGITLNVVNLGTNLYIGVFLNAIIEWPAFAITAAVLDRFGRRSMLISAMVLSGLCCLAGSVLYIGDEANTDSSDGLRDLFPNLTAVGSYRESVILSYFSPRASIGVNKVLRIICSTIGIFGMAGTYNLVYIYASELFPTVVRNAALGLMTQASGIGSIIAPVVVVSGRFNSALPLATFGIMAILGGALSLGLPETLHKPMFETLEGLERSERGEVK